MGPGTEAIATSPHGDPKDEYFDISENLRHWAQIRFAQMTLFVAITAGILAVLFYDSSAVSNPGRAVFKIGGLIVTGIFSLLDQRAIVYWRYLKRRAIELEEILDFQQYTKLPSAVYFNSANAVRVLYLVIFLFWVTTLAWNSRF